MSTGPFFRSLAMATVLKELRTLYRTATGFPAIDNHAHPLLKEEKRNAVPFEAVISEAEGSGLTRDALHTLACLRATKQLGDVLGLHPNSSWEDVKSSRADIQYATLCEKFMKPCRIQCLMLDDGLYGVDDFCLTLGAHAIYSQEIKRILRVEVEAERILTEMRDRRIPDTLLFETFTEQLDHTLAQYAEHPNVVAFKSIACYRTGLAISPSPPQDHVVAELVQLFNTTRGKFRLASKNLNDFIVCAALRAAAKGNIPIQFHTGLGDNDLSLSLASPSLLQPVIKAFPETNFVLLHSSYPYTRDAGYLTAVYENVYLDFGEVFPFVSAEGQRDIIRQVLELAPTNKILWSTDGHWFPESFYLGTIQSRDALFKVLGEIVIAGDLTEEQAVQIVQNALFYNSNRLYNLGLVPIVTAH